MRHQCTPSCESRESYFADHLGRFSIVDCFQVLLHRSVIVPLLVQVIPILSKDGVSLAVVDAGFLGKIDG